MNVLLKFLKDLFFLPKEEQVIVSQYIDVDVTSTLASTTKEVEESEGYYPYDGAVILSCYFNVTDSPYRRDAFLRFYDTIKHLNHRIVECLIGDQKPILPNSPFISVVRTDNVLWHKESLLNGLIKNLPDQFRFVFWVDGDIIFKNRYWIIDSIEALYKYPVIQPWEYVLHLEQDAHEPPQLAYDQRSHVFDKTLQDRRIWKSFGSNVAQQLSCVRDQNYDVHGHSGYAWGMRRDILEQIYLFDSAIIGSGDSVMAQSFFGDLESPCIVNTFKNSPEMIELIKEYRDRAYPLIKGQIGYIQGDIFHIWHGEKSKRQYLSRSKNFIGDYRQIQRDSNGLPVIKDKKTSDYVSNYFASREIHGDESLLTDYIILDMLTNGSENHGNIIQDDSQQQPVDSNFEFGGGQPGGGGAGSEYDLSDDEKSAENAESDTSNQNYGDDVS